MGGGGNAAGGGDMATRGGGCRPIWGCGGGGCTFAFFLGSWPCSGRGKKRVPSARCDRSGADTYPAAVITGIRARVWSPANARHTASKQVTYLFPCRRLSCGKNLVDPKWARRAPLTAEVVMVFGLRPETSMVSWREAGGPHPCLGGGGVSCLPGGRRDWGLGLVRPKGRPRGLGGVSRQGPRGPSLARWPGHREGRKVRCGRVGTGGLAGLPVGVLPARLPPLVFALRPPGPRLGTGQQEGVPFHPARDGWLPGAQAGSDDIPPWSLTSASIACRPSGRAAVATAPTRAVQKVRPSVVCRRAARMSGVTSTVHVMAVATATKGVVLGRAATDYHSRSAHCWQVSSAMVRYSPASMYAKQSASAAATA